MISNEYVIVSLRYTGEILDELLNRAKNFKLGADRAEFMINQAYRYFPAYDIRIKKSTDKTIEGSLQARITNSLVEMHGEKYIKTEDIRIDESHRLNNGIYWIKLNIKCDRNKGIQEVMDSGKILVLIKEV